MEPDADSQTSFLFWTRSVCCRRLPHGVGRRLADQFFFFGFFFLDFWFFGFLDFWTVGFFGFFLDFLDFIFWIYFDFDHGTTI